jgi:uncharacterized protein (TIGR02118 family)
MIKIISMWKRNPDITEEACEEHYLNAHTELAIKALAKVPGFRRYVQNKVISQTVYNFNDGENPAQVEPDFDRMVELYFDDKDALVKALESPEMKACYEDHTNFMNVCIPRNLVIYEVAEAIPLELQE